LDTINEYHHIYLIDTTVRKHINTSKAVQISVPTSMMQYDDNYSDVDMTVVLVVMVVMIMINFRSSGVSTT